MENDEISQIRTPKEGATRQRSEWTKSEDKKMKDSGITTLSYAALTFKRIIAFESKAGKPLHAGNTIASSKVLL